MRRGPRDLLDLDVDVGVFLFKSSDELREDFALSAHRPDAQSCFIASRGARAGGNRERKNKNRSERERCLHWTRRVKSHMVKVSQFRRFACASPVRKPLFLYSSRPSGAATPPPP